MSAQTDPPPSSPFAGCAGGFALAGVVLFAAFVGLVWGARHLAVDAAG